MTLALASCPRAACVTYRRSSSCRTRHVVSVKALSVQEATNWIGQAFVRIFSRDDSKVENYPTNAWTGRIDRSKKPFKDGFMSNAPLPPSSTLELTEDAAGYVEDAVKGALSGFPRKADDDEPNWTGATTAWRGDVHKSANKRDAREGFHTKKY